MIFATDVYYHDNNTATAAGVLFEDWASPLPLKEVVTPVVDVAEYVPGEFYRQELPCLLALLRDLGEPPQIIIVDGFVDVGPDHPGLGRHLANATGIPIIGVAKTFFQGAQAVEVHRGGSAKPLYVTSCGKVSVDEAAQLVKQMHGDFRFPTLLKRVDVLSRQ